MSANQEHVHLAWPLWSNLRVIPTHGEFCSLVRPLANFARSCLVDLIRMTTSVRNNSVFRSFFEKQKLIGPNFIDWYRQLRLVLSTEDKEKYLEQPIPAAPVAAAPDQPISPQASTTYNECYNDQLERLGHPITLQLGLNLILVGLSKEYDSFVQNYNMHSMGKTVQKNKNKKPSKAAKGVQGKGKGKKAYANTEPSYAPKPKIPKPPKKDNPAKDAICHYCGEHYRLGHISKKRIEKLQHDGLLNSSDIESLGKCVSCMSGKMARKPYSHQVERAKDLLGLIHTDSGDVRIEQIDNDDNLADPFTKALAFPKHFELTRKIGLIPASSLMQIYV
ncbi:retrotransposon protein, putative, ty1-copia subclass [Tanacetum coccineum]